MNPKLRLAVLLAALACLLVDAWRQRHGNGRVLLDLGLALWLLPAVVDAWDAV